MTSSTRWACCRTENCSSERGNDGAVLELDGNHVFSRLVKATSRQVTSIAAGPGGKLFLAAANPGKIFTLGPENESEGTYESQPFDAHIFSRWGRTRLVGRKCRSPRMAPALRESRSMRAPATRPIRTPTGATGPARTQVPPVISSTAPPRDFVQWKAVLRGAGGGPAPEIDWFSIAYLPKNIAPEVTAIALQDPGVRVQGIAIAQSGSGHANPRAASHAAAAAVRILAKFGVLRHVDSRIAAIRRARRILSRCRRACRKKATSPCCGPRTTPMTTSWNSPFIFAAKMKPPGSC